jgi:hypothetical protein
MEPFPLRIVGIALIVMGILDFPLALFISTRITDPLKRLFLLAGLSLAGVAEIVLGILILTGKLLAHP